MALRGLLQPFTSPALTECWAKLLLSVLKLVVEDRREMRSCSPLLCVHSLRREVQSALETVGLDPAAGYLHTLRPGRPSLALDLMEELRGSLCDRFVLTLFHRKQLSATQFEQDEEAVYLNEKGRRTMLSAWQKRKSEPILHPFLGEKVPIGLIPYAQAMLLARVLRGDLDCYPPFVWR